MEQTRQDLIKHREIVFRGPHEDPQQARTAVLVLSDVEGVVRARPEGPHLVYVSYDVTLVTLHLLENLLAELGFHLDNNLLTKLKRALYAYTEDAQRDSLGCGKGQTNCTQKLFIRHYQSRPHGCRDPRPEHWRHYL